MAGTASPRLTELRLTRFKSFRDETIEISPLLLLTGRNSSGKSNIFDAASVLSMARWRRYPVHRT